MAHFGTHRSEAISGFDTEYRTVSSNFVGRLTDTVGDDAQSPNGEVS